MDKARKVARIQRILDELYPEPQIPLDHVDPFTLLVAVVLSAQTTDARVNLVTPALFARADTPRKLAKLPLEEIHALIKTCGLAPAKAKNLKALSQILVERHGGEVPRTFEELEALPGVGHKTAGVVLVQAFGIPAFPVDTHIHRLAARWGLSSGRNVVETERDLKEAFPVDAWARAHIQIILFGREHCPALRHDASGCPICSWAAVPQRAAARSKRAGRTSAKRAARGEPARSSGAARAGSGARASRVARPRPAPAAARPRGARTKKR